MNLQDTKVYLKFGLSIFEGLPRIFLVIFKEKKKSHDLIDWRGYTLIDLVTKPHFLAFFEKNLANSFQEFWSINQSFAKNQFADLRHIIIHKYRKQEWFKFCVYVELYQRIQNFFSIPKIWLHWDFTMNKTIF